MYRGINGTPPSRAPSCTNPTPLNYHRPPPLRPSRSALSLSAPHPLPLFLPSRLPPFPSLTATPSNPLPSFQLHPSLSLYYMYARMYICTSFCLASLAPRPSPAVLRLSPRYDHLRIRLPSTRPRSAPEQPSIRYRCVQPRGEEPLLPG